MKNVLRYAVLCGLILFSTNIAKADTVNVYINNNNNAPQYGYGGGYYRGGTMCSDDGSICTNGYYIMSSRRTRYVAPQWKRQTLREQRLSMEANRQSI